MYEPKPIEPYKCEWKLVIDGNGDVWLLKRVDGEWINAPEDVYEVRSYMS